MEVVFVNFIVPASGAVKVEPSHLVIVQLAAIGFDVVASFLQAYKNKTRSVTKMVVFFMVNYFLV